MPDLLVKRPEHVCRGGPDLHRPDVFGGTVKDSELTPKAIDAEMGGC